MAEPFRITRVTELTPAIRALAPMARSDGFGFVDTLIAAWDNGTNRFDRPGECYLAVWRGERLVAIGGLNHDPYSGDAGTGRVRHLYVLPEARRSGAGTALMHAIVDAARRSFTVLRLRTTTPRGAAFYEALGFARSDAPDASHTMPL